MKIVKVTGRGKKFEKYFNKNYSISALKKELETDNLLHEVIPLEDQRFIRPYFDIDFIPEMVIDPKILLEYWCGLICKEFGCLTEDMAICSGNRPGKISYHIIIKKKIQVSNFKKRLVNLSCIDMTLYSFECLRLPGQSGYGGQAPMIIVQGNLEDFFVTSTNGLEEIR